jgi:SAM-dependent methyltransferase
MGALDGVRELYRERFDSKEREQKNRLWKIICPYLQRYFPEEGAVLDLGAGYCEFINNIKAGRKIAVDMNPDTAQAADPNVAVYQSRCESLPFLESGMLDGVFLSNVLEHLDDKAHVMSVMLEIHRVLKEGGVMVILMPNIRFAYREYWDFFDHQVPLTEKSVVEAAQMAGFKTRKVIAAFLPYTTKSRIPQWDILVRTYLALPLLWRIFGKQALVVVEKRAAKV